MDMHPKGVSESMKTDDRADMKSTGTAVRQERASRKLRRGKYTNKDRQKKKYLVRRLDSSEGLFSTYLGESLIRY